MAVASVANPGERHIDPLAEQRRERQAGSNSAARVNAAPNTVAQDTYTPSDNFAQATAQAAGIFQLNPAALASSAVPAQPAPAADQNAASLPPPAPVAATNSPAAQTAVATTGTAANVAQQAATTATGAPAPQATATDTINTAAQGQVQSLNNALAALGLSRSDIQQIDRIAALIQNFDPSAYMDLVNQFQRQAQQAQQLAGPVNAGAATATATAQTAAAAGTGAYQLEGIAVSYASPTATQSAGNSGPVAGANNSPAAPQLQIQQVQFTLTNGSGQTFQVQAPQQSTNAGTPNLQTPQARTSAV